MFSEESARFMELAAEYASPFPPNPSHYNPNLARFFPYRLQMSVWEMCGALYHQYYQGASSEGASFWCASCIYDYGGHRAGLERGRNLLRFPSDNAEERV